MKPLKLVPVFKDYLWGGSKLREEFGKDTDMYPLAESWELSCHKNGMSRLADNPDMTLDEYIKISDEDVLGENAKGFDRFPVLLKLIDAKKNLSVQVHPDDEYAFVNENQFGKTEAWYVLSAEKDAKIIFGLKEKVTGEQLKKHIEDDTLLNIVNEVNAKSGDLFFIEPGTIHAIGAGISIAEIQQNSDVTYRVYDYGRLGADGKLRQLHIDKACDVVAHKDTEEKKYDIKQRDGYTLEKLVECKYFSFSKAIVKKDFTHKVTKKSFVSLLCIDGNGSIISGDTKQEIAKGDSYFCSAGDYTITLDGEVTVLITTI